MNTVEMFSDISVKIHRMNEQSWKSILSQTPIHINKDVLIYGIQEKGIAKFLYKL